MLDFWEVIKITKPPLEEYSVENHYEKVKTKLGSLSANDLVEFELTRYFLANKAQTWNLLGAAYVINNGCSDSRSMDFLCGVIFQGKNVYEKAIEDADTLVELDEEIALHLIEYELFGYVAAEVFVSNTSSSLEDFEILLHRKLETLKLENDPGDYAGEAWGEVEELRIRLPKLSQKYPDLFEN